MKREIPREYLQHLRSRHHVELQGTGVRPRSVLLGALLVAAISLGAPYSIWIAGSSEITWSYFPVAAGFPFFLLVLANGLVTRFSPDWRLRPAELTTVLLMGLVGSGMPIFVVGYILGIITKPYYGALPTNKWETYLHPYLPDWLIPSPAGDAMRFFYEGLPDPGATIPYGTWIGPLFWWMSLVLALYSLCFCLVAIMRRQWVEKERLAFPLVEVPLLLTEEKAPGQGPPLLRTTSFWVGGAIPLGVILFNMISYLYPGASQVPVFQANPLDLIPGAPPIQQSLWFPVIGFTYFVPTSISFSVWFFYLFTAAETALEPLLGSSTMAPDAFVFGWRPLSWQSYGAFVAMVLWSLWMARDHLRSALAAALRGGGCDDSEDEMLSYRAAAVGLLVSGAYLLAWLWRAGMNPGVAALFLVGAVLTFVGITRLVIQTGLHYLTTPMTAQGFALAFTGTALGPHNLVPLAISYAWCGDVQSTFMPSVAHGAKLQNLYQTRRSHALAAALGLAIVLGFVVSTLFILHLCYRHGAGNLRSWFFSTASGAGGMAFDQVVRQLREPSSTDWHKLTYFGSGALLYSLLSFLHYRLPWWPLHPVGLAISSIWMLHRTVASVFIAWGLKRLILRFGGVGLYRRLRPLFIGLIVGFFVGVGLSCIVDAIWFRGAGHYILNG